MSIYHLGVGRLYNPERTQYPETEQFRVGRYVCELVRYWPSPTRDEVEQHQVGHGSFGLTDESPDLLVLSYRFGTLDWSDAPFQAHRMTSAERSVPDFEPAQGATLTTVLVDSNTGIIRALRLDALSAEFCQRLESSVAAQLASPFDNDKAIAKLNRLYLQYASPEEMVTQRADSISIME